MVEEEDKDSSLKRERPRDEEDAEAEDIEEPPRKVVKRNDDEAEKDTADTDEKHEDTGEEAAATCGTDTGCKDNDDGEGEPPEDNAKNVDTESKEETKDEDTSKEEKKTEVADSANPSNPVETKAPEEETKEPESAVSESKEPESSVSESKEPESTASEAKEPEVAAVLESKEPETAVSDLPPGVPSGLPSISPVDPTAVATVTNPNPLVEEREELQKDLVGRVIGKGGEMIRDLQARSGCRVDVDQNVPAESPRIITYRGTRQAVDFAKQLVATLCTQEGRDSDLPLGMATRKQLIVPSSSIGKIIGRGGEMIRDLQTRSKCKIQVDHSGAGVADPNDRQVIVTGTADAVVKAEEMIMFLVANPSMDAATAIDMLVEDKARGGMWGSGPPYPNLPNQGANMQIYAGQYSAQPPGGYTQSPGEYGGYDAAGTEMEIFYAAKNFMGRIIGSRGITINDLQKRSGCNIQINQDVPPGQDCEITLKGSRQGIEMVKTMLREIIELGPNHPYAGGGGAVSAAQTTPYDYAGGGGYPQDAYGQAAPMQPYQYQQPAAQQAPYGAAYAPYGAPMYQPSPYGQQAMPGYQAPPQQYGMPQQPYGGYPQPAMQQAPPPAATWRTATTADGQTYYYNEKTGETQWEKPMGM